MKWNIIILALMASMSIGAEELNIRLIRFKAIHSSVVSFDRWNSDSEDPLFLQDVFKLAANGEAMVLTDSCVTMTKGGGYYSVDDQRVPVFFLEQTEDGFEINSSLKSGLCYEASYENLDGVKSVISVVLADYRVKQREKVEGDIKGTSLGKPQVERVQANVGSVTFEPNIDLYCLCYFRFDDFVEVVFLQILDDSEIMDSLGVVSVGE